MLKSWRVWLVLLTCSLFFTSAVITYLIEWSAGWFFAATTIFAGISAWIGEEDFRAFHHFQVITLKRQLAEAQDIAVEAQEKDRDRQEELDFFHARIRDVTDQFLDDQTHVCRECGAKNIWHYTQYKFHPEAHNHGCLVVQFRALVEPPPLWLPEDFEREFLDPEWLDEMAVASNPAIADVFARETKPGDHRDRKTG